MSFLTIANTFSQLIQRMERSLTVAIANVESLLRKTIAAAQALALESDELRGLARSSNELVSAFQAGYLQEQCQTLLIAIESALTSLVDARFRFRDWIAWLRATGSLIKARGTAANSVQRENAKKRRVPDDTARRILRYIQENSGSEPRGSVSGVIAVRSISASETLLGVDVSQHWDVTDQVLSSSSPQSVLATISSRLVPSIPTAYRTVADAAHHIFELPSEAMKGCFHRYDFELAMSQGDSDVVAITTRLGGGGIEKDLSYGDSALSGFFEPQIRDELGLSSIRDFRQWAISAQCLYPKGRSCLVSVCAVPLRWYTICTTRQWDDDRRLDRDFKFYLQAALELPPGYTVQELAFYGDNGKSGLFSGSDNTTCLERRQALAALLGRDSDDDHGYILELWMIKYDQAQWHRGELRQSSEHDMERVVFSPIHALSHTEVIPITRADYEEDAGDIDPIAAIRCKTRQVCKFDSVSAASSTRLVLSGSRGIAAVVSSPSGSHVLDVFDLEEDDEDDEDVNMDGSGT